ncbi:hypothetical protein BF3057 [Bacteroides fragilis YCH46]|uniref:Uncharacterized protein n=1 Tax=Bacteroides fragilis (strain YCH46) TaxID=295405 RepID=Q64RS8_BACFR|nr:hypothetical protein BF3057 [Bacteroides fragilis YCH46]
MIFFSEYRSISSTNKNILKSFVHLSHVLIRVLSSFFNFVVLSWKLTFFLNCG